MLSLNKRVKCNYGTWIFCTSLKRYKVGCDILKAYLHEIMPKNQSASWYDFFQVERSALAHEQTATRFPDQPNQSQHVRRGGHVRMCRPILSLTFAICILYMRGVIQHTKVQMWALSAQPIPRYEKGVRTCARADQYPCRLVNSTYKHVIIQHTWYKHFRPSRSPDM